MCPPPKLGAALPNSPLEGIDVPPNKPPEELAEEAPAKDVLPTAIPEPKMEADVPVPKGEGAVDGPEETNVEELGADEEPNKDKLGAGVDGALAAVRDPGVPKAGNGDDPEKIEDPVFKGPEDGADAGVALNSMPAD